MGEYSGVIVIWIISVVISTIIGAGKNRVGAGFALGFFLGFIGLIIIAVMQPLPAAGAPAQAPAMSAATAADELAKYAKLYKNGVLTKEEFEAKKKELL